MTGSRSEVYIISRCDRPGDPVEIVGVVETGCDDAIDAVLKLKAADRDARPPRTPRHYECEKAGMLTLHD